MGIYDLPAIITYINEITSDKIIYIGHSMGTTMFYVFSSEKPDIATKIKFQFSFSPIAFMGHLSSFPLHVFAKLLGTWPVKVNEF